jgi:uncharacterized protein YndB with AHSA1/START domain
MVDDRVLVMERVFKTTPEKLFAAWTTPRLIVSWWGPEGMTTPVSSFDVRAGGAWSATLRNGEGKEFSGSGVYLAVERPRHLAFTWAWRQPDGSRGHETVVDLVFEPVEGGTRQTLTQKTFADADQRDRHDHGWTSSFNKLARVVE